MTASRVDVRIERVTVEFRVPIVTSYGELRKRELVYLRIEDSEGLVAYGEAAALEPYDGVSVESVEAALTAYQPLLEERFYSEPSGTLLRDCHKIAPLCQALAAVDLAKWDLHGKLVDDPISARMIPAPARAIRVNATPIGDDLSELAADAARLVEAGFRTLKLKVGTEQDLQRVAAVRDAVGEYTKIRVDANGAWTVEEALTNLDLLAEFEIELCEEPVADLAPLREVAKRSPIPIAIDESGTSFDAITSSGCQVACLKISRLGGIDAVRKAAKFARGEGMSVYLASTYDGPLGIAAALHAAAAIEPDHDSGLDTTGLLKLENPFHTYDGRILVPWEPGLGVSPPPILEG